MHASKNPLEHLLAIAKYSAKKKTMGIVHRLKGI